MGPYFHSPYPPASYPVAQPPFAPYAPAPYVMAPAPAAAIQAAPVQPATVPTPTVQTAPLTLAEPAQVQQSPVHAEPEPIADNLIYDNPAAPAEVSPAAPAEVSPFGAEGLCTVDVDFEWIESAIGESTIVPINPAGLERYLPFVLRAVTITANRYPMALRERGPDGEISVVVRSIRDGIEHDLVIDDAGNRRITGIASSLETRSHLASALHPDSANLMVVAIDHEGSGERFYSEIGHYPLVLTLTNVAKRPTVGTDTVGSVAMSMHNMGSIGLAWGGDLNPDMCDVFISELKHQLEHRDWSTELD